ncbi:MAG: hypothetical protein UT34_C0002G0182 [candidate division WS6 bacterium GW2011_GWF2_39_15]|uniref:Uncharacterized protein n=1 Tax=candidate division WS6 bacterium GW2011_GWF2_39_15 TaxID=1619100 RepID=A0A0G0Q5J0_9BACT|nr:MAG: hypothetical protein UT34_C0002G0182 [candidate division WS6 bacterium GW2011_GWF2_39_15]
MDRRDRLEFLETTLKNYRELDIGNDIVFEEAVYLAKRCDNPFCINRFGLAIPEPDIESRANFLALRITQLDELMALESKDDFALDLGATILLVIREMYSLDSVLSFRTAVWSKYLSNETRYSFVVQRVRMAGFFTDEEMWNAAMRESKHIIESSYRKESLELEEYLELMQGNKLTSPFGADSLRLFQIASEYWMLSLGKPTPFTRGDLYNLLISEVSELLEAASNIKKGSPDNREARMKEYSFELADVFNYLMQMLTVMGYDLSATIRKASGKRYRETLGIGRELALGRKILWNRRFKWWREKRYEILLKSLK